MLIWSAEIKELEALYTSVRGHFTDLEKDLEHLIKTDDENVALLYSRRCMEVIITELCECELNRPRKTEPLKGIIDKLHREDKVPDHIITSMESLNSLSTYGTHPKEFDPEQVKPVLNNLSIILKWYLKYKDTLAVNKGKPEEVKLAEEQPPGKQMVDTKVGIIKSKKKLIFLLSGFLLIVVIVIVLLFTFDIIGGQKQTKEIEKSIAVLPFVNDSRDEENTYFINGIMEEVLLNLQTIKDLRVPGRTSVEQYRNMSKSIPEIAKELGVNYIVEGSGQKYGNTIRLRIQLLEGGKDKHLWGESYEQVIESPEDIFNIQSQIAQSIAAEVKAIITPEEQQTIEKIPTTSLTAWDYYQRGKEEVINFYLHSGWRQDYDQQEGLSKAENFYMKALDYDSAFAPAYSGLAIVYIYKNRRVAESYFAENFLDSSMILADKSLSFDDKLAEAYYVKGLYYKENGKPELAKVEYEKAIKYNPNYWEAYTELGSYIYSELDLVKSIENYQKAITLNHGKEFPALLSGLATAYCQAGFFDKLQYSLEEVIGMFNDTIYELYFLAAVENNLFLNHNKAIDYCKIGYKLDSNNVDILYELGSNYMFLGQYSESLKYFKKYIERVKNLGHLRLNSTHRIAYVFWQNGYKKEAAFYFNEQKRNCEEAINKGRSYATDGSAYYDLAGIYAFLGDREKAYENLRIWAKKPLFTLWWINFIKNDPLFENLNNDAEFRQIVANAEANYQAEHERVGKWLEEKGI